MLDMGFDGRMTRLARKIDPKARVDAERRFDPRSQRTRPSGKVTITVTSWEVAERLLEAGARLEAPT